MSTVLFLCRQTPDGQQYIDWDLPDPAHQTIDTVRAIRDGINRRVRALVTDLDASPTQKRG